MDLGIAGKKALVCGASAGLGFACAEALVKDGVHVVIVARTEGPLMDAAARLAAHGAGRVDWVAADVTTAEGRAYLRELSIDELPGLTTPETTAVTPFQRITAWAEPSREPVTSAEAASIWPMRLNMEHTPVAGWRCCS